MTLDFCIVVVPYCSSNVVWQLHTIYTEMVHVLVATCPQKCVAIDLSPTMVQQGYQPGRDGYNTFWIPKMLEYMESFGHGLQRVNLRDGRNILGFAESPPRQWHFYSPHFVIRFQGLYSGNSNMAMHPRRRGYALSMWICYSPGFHRACPIKGWAIPVVHLGFK